MTKEKESTLPSVKDAQKLARVVDEAHRYFWAVSYELPVPFKKIDDLAKKSFDMVSGVLKYDRQYQNKKGFQKRAIYQLFLSFNGSKIELGSLEILELKRASTQIQSHLPQGALPHDIVVARLFQEGLRTTETQDESPGDIATRRPLLQKSLETIKTQIAFHRAYIQYFILVLDANRQLDRSKGGDLMHLPLRLPENRGDNKTGPTQFFHIHYRLY